ncbi:MAG: hypothetical protein JW810_09120 [Sedimentisphaerales bacterium]|nr:hypothetical protein [Sedimentisphaerales bacterium]
MVEQMNHIAGLWWHWQAGMFWQVGVLIVLIGLLDRLIRRWAWPQLRYSLWLLVLVKLVLPPGLTLPTSLTANVEPWLHQAVTPSRSVNPATAAGDLLPMAPSLSGPITAADPESIPLTEERQAQADAFLLSAGSGLATADAQSPSAAGIDSARSDRPANEIDAKVAVPAGTAGATLSWQWILMLIWLLGAGTLAGWFLFHWRQLARQVRHRPAGQLPDWFDGLLGEAAATLGLRRLPAVVLCDRVASPAVFGLFRPVLLMPTDFLATMQIPLPAQPDGQTDTPDDAAPDRRDIRHVLLHELAHIKRRDPLVHTFNLLLQIVYWYHPLLWLVRRQLQHLRELCCDATVAGVLREGTGAYRQTLLQTARRLLDRRVECGLGLLGLFENSHRLVARLRWLEKSPWRYARLRLVVAAAMIVLVSACVLPMAQAQKDTAAADVPTAADATTITTQDAPATPILRASDSAISQTNFREVFSEVNPGGMGGMDPGVITPASPLAVSPAGFKRPAPILIEAQYLHAAAADVPADVTVSGAHGELAISIVAADRIDALIERLRGREETRLLAAPKVLVNAGNTAQLFIGGEPAADGISRGLRMQVLPTLDDQNRIELDMQLSRKAVQLSDQRAAQGFYEGQVTLKARLQSGQSLLAALPEDFQINPIDPADAGDADQTGRTLLILTATIQPSPPASPAAAIPAPTPARTLPLPADSTTALRDKLENTVVSLDLDEIEFRQVLELLRRSHGLNLNVLWGSLETEAGINQDDTVSLHLKDVSLLKALDSVMAYISSGKMGPAMYCLDRGVITIGAESELPNQFLVPPARQELPEPSVAAPAAPSLAGGSYPGDRPAKWYLLIEELRGLQQQRFDWETRISQQRFELGQLKAQRSEDHPDIKAAEEYLKRLHERYENVLRDYDQAAMRMRDLEERIERYQQIAGELEFHRQQLQKIQQRILDATIDIDSATGDDQQKKAMSLLEALTQQRNVQENQLERKQQEAQEARRQLY